MPAPGQIRKLQMPVDEIIGLPLEFTQLLERIRFASSNQLAALADIEPRMRMKTTSEHSAMSTLAGRSGTGSLGPNPNPMDAAGSLEKTNDDPLSVQKLNLPLRGVRPGVYSGTYI